MLLWQPLLLLLLVSGLATAQPLPSRIPYVDSNGEWGYCNAAGRVLITPQWKAVNFFTGNRAMVVNKYWDTRQALYSVIDTNGRYIVPPEMHWNGEWDGWGNTAFNAFDSNGKRGIIDSNGKVMVALQYDTLMTLFTANNAWGVPAAVIKKDGYCGVIDTAGRVRVPFEYDNIGLQDCAHLPGKPVRVRKNGKENLLYSNNIPLLPRWYTLVVPHRDDTVGLYIFEGRKTGYVAYPSLKMLLPPRYIAINRMGKFTAVSTDSVHLYFSLLDSNYQPCLPDTCIRIGVSGDTISLWKMMQPRNAEEAADEEEELKYVNKNGPREFSRFYNASTLRPLTDWIREHEHYGWQRPHCGGIQEPKELRQGLTTPRVQVNNAYVTTFTKDSIIWHIISQKNNPYGHILAHGSLVGGGPPYFSCIIDDNLNYVVRPMSGDTQITGFNPTDSLITVYYQGTSGVLNMAQKEVFPFVESSIRYPFLWKGLVYARLNYGHEALEPNLIVYPCHYRDNIMGPDGQYMKLPRGWRFRAMADKWGVEHNVEDYPCLVVEDSDHHIGFVAVTGEVLYPAVSFKYKDIKAVGDGLFRVALGDIDRETRFELRDSAGRVLFPGAKFTSVRPAFILQKTSGGFADNCPQQPCIPHLYVACYRGVNGEERKFYFHSDGRRYGRSITDMH